VSAVLDAIHKRHATTCQLLGELHWERAQIDERIDVLTAELRAIQRAADMVPPATAPEGKESP